MWGGFGSGIWAVKANAGGECGYRARRLRINMQYWAFGLGQNTRYRSSMGRAVQRHTINSFFHLLLQIWVHQIPPPVYDIACLWRCTTVSRRTTLGTDYFYQIASAQRLLKQCLQTTVYRTRLYNDCPNIRGSGQPGSICNSTLAIYYNKSPVRQHDPRKLFRGAKPNT